MKAQDPNELVPPSVSAPASQVALDERLERATRFARRLFQVPIVAVTLMKAGTLAVRVCQGLPVGMLGRQLPMDDLVVSGGHPVLVTDLSNEPKLEAFRMSVGRRPLCGYAACPIRDAEGSVIGVLTIADTIPRSFGKSDLVLLEDLAALAETDLLVTTLGESRLKLLAAADRLRSNALIDPLTQLWNRTALVDLVQRELSRAKRYREPFALLMMGIDDFGDLREVEGQPIADLVVVEVANRFRSCLRGSDAIGRFDDSSLAAFLGNCSPAAAGTLTARLRAQFLHKPVNVGRATLPVTVSFGVVTGQDGLGSADACIDRACASLAEARESGIDQAVTRSLP